jgi:ADP-ribosylation factor GTPase-activating protein 2/3
MGVHTTFVRSLDLDEWTQRQIDAMRLGGNANARKYFREHGLTDMHGKIEKKYTSKAANAYRAELQKQVDAAAVQRGEAVTTTTTSVDVGGGLLENLSLQDKQNAAAAAAQSAAKPVATAVPTAKLASQMAGARGRLVVTPPSSGNLTSGSTSTSSATAGMLRKPAGKSMNSKMLLKKPSSGSTGGKLRMNKLSVNKIGSGDDDNVAGFDEVEEQPAPAPAPAPVVAAPPSPAPAPVAPPSPKEPEQPKNVMQDGVSRLQAMNQDFFSGV